MNNMYPMLEFEVVDQTDKSDMFAINNFVLKAKPKAIQKTDPQQKAEDKPKEVRQKS